MRNIWRRGLGAKRAETLASCWNETRRMVTYADTPHSKLVRYLLGTSRLVVTSIPPLFSKYLDNWRCSPESNRGEIEDYCGMRKVSQIVENETFDDFCERVKNGRLMKLVTPRIPEPNPVYALCYLRSTEAMTVCFVLVRVQLNMKSISLFFVFGELLTKPWLWAVKGL